MKNNHFIMVMLSLFVLYNCTQDQDLDTPNQKTNVSFTLSTSGAITGRTRSNGLSSVKSVILSITSPKGEVITTYKQLNINSFGDGFITEPLALDAGHYVLTDFFLVGDSAKILYATPHKGSSLGVLPKQPLDREFTVASGKTSTMAMEVVEVEGYAPEDFGYKSFSVAALKFFALAIKIADKSGNLVYTKAMACLLQGTDTIAKYNAGPAPTFIKFNDTPGAEYDLAVIKDGYARYQKHFSYPELIKELNHKPLLAILEPALTFWTDSEQTETGIGMTYVPNLLFNWGDGVSETNPPEDSVTNYDGFAKNFHSHNRRKYFVSITGDLHQIVDIQEFWGCKAYNVSALPNLRILNLYVSEKIDVIDLSQNSKLEFINIYNTKKIILSKENNLSHLKIQSAKNDLDYIINNVYSNAVRNGTFNGYIDFSNDYYGNEGSDPIAIPTAASKVKLKILRDKYHWSVYPSLDSF